MNYWKLSLKSIFYKSLYEDNFYFLNFKKYLKSGNIECENM